MSKNNLSSLLSEKMFTEFLSVIKDVSYNVRCVLLAIRLLDIEINFSLSSLLSTFLFFVEMMQIDIYGRTVYIREITDLMREIEKYEPKSEIETKILALFNTPNIQVFLDCICSTWNNPNIII